MVLGGSLCGCATDPVAAPANERPFNFATDTLAFENKLRWDYQADPRTGNPRRVARKPAPDYSLHCFVMSRSARQFFQFARFDPTRRQVDDGTYRQLIESVIAHDPAETGSTKRRVLIPGYADLRTFSADKEAILKDELGSAVQSYLQRGNWRMIFPFSHEHQKETAESLLAELRVDRPPVVHLATFPEISINHAVLLISASETATKIRFGVYDPNSSTQPTSLTYDRKHRAFRFPRTRYFLGGEVDVYEVYKSVVY